jgi:hypothetical protein
MTSASGLVGLLADVCCSIKSGAKADVPISTLGANSESRATHEVPKVDGQEPP